MMKRYYALLVAFALGMFTATGVAAQEEITLNPSEDNTIYEESGALSNAVGQHLFAGRTGTNVPDGPWNRRALIAFDVAGALPEDVRIESVVLTMEVSKAPFLGPVETDMTLHRLTHDWGEGTSDAPGQEGDGADATTDDATWTYAFYDSEEWGTPGGDYEADASATFTVEGTGEYSIGSTEAMVADVQAWADDPSTNFGWIIIGDESQQHTARRFDSSEYENEERQPVLTITYVETTASERDDLPRTLVVDGNYPNPFTGRTTIRYALDKPDAVTLKVFDVLGRPVLEINNGVQAVGPHRINVSDDGLAAGTYIYCLEGKASARDCRSMLVLP